MDWISQEEEYRRKVDEQVRQERTRELEKKHKKEERKFRDFVFYLKLLLPEGCKIVAEFPPNVVLSCPCRNVPGDIPRSLPLNKYTSAHYHALVRVDIGNGTLLDLLQYDWQESQGGDRGVLIFKATEGIPLGEPLGRLGSLDDGRYLGGKDYRKKEVRAALYNALNALARRS